MNILLLGPQGSGKGTQARLLVAKFGFTYFEAGNFLRNLASKDQELKESLAKGFLVPGEEMSSYVTSYLDENKLYDNILFDGFPRTLEQYKFFQIWSKEKNVSFDLVIVLKINEEETIRRLSARRQDPETGKIYNLITDPPPKDIDVSKLVQRDDDKSEAIKKRLALYKEFTSPLIEELKKVVNVIEVDGDRPIDEIQTELVSIINEKSKS